MLKLVVIVSTLLVLVGCRQKPGIIAIKHLEGTVIKAVSLQQDYDEADFEGELPTEAKAAIASFEKAHPKLVVISFVYTEEAKIGNNEGPHSAWIHGVPKTWFVKPLEIRFTNE